MDVTKYSRNRFYTSLNEWAVPKEYADRMFEYIVHGYHPGSFYTALLANDFMSAMAHSHPANSIIGLKALIGWLRSTMLYGVAYGSYEAVANWVNMSDSERRTKLNERKILYTEQEEIMLALSNERTHEPVFLE